MTTTAAHYPPPGTKPADHPFSSIFPMLDAAALDDLARDIKANGQRDPIILLDGLVLDGRNRRDACFRVKVEPFYRFFDPRHDGQSPLNFVLSHNLKRRHLTMSQAAAVAAEALPLFEAESAEKKKAAGQAKASNLKHQAPAATPAPLPPSPPAIAWTGSTAAKKPATPTTTPNAAPDEFDQRTPASEEAGHEPAKPSKTMAGALAAATPAKKTPKAAKTPKPAPAAPATPPAAKGRAATAAAKAGAALGVSERQVRGAKKLQKEAPEKFAAVKAGKTTVAKATKEAALEREDVVQAIAKIRKVCGRSLGDAVQEQTRLKGAKEILAYAALDDAEMLRLRGLIDAGWTVARAKKYKAGSLGRTHRLHDLLDRAASAGGHFTLEIEGYRIEVSPIASK